MTQRIVLSAVVLALLYAAIQSGVFLYNGAFDASGLPQQMLVGRQVGQALMVAGWGAVFLLSIGTHSKTAAFGSFFLAGMFLFDFVTTAQLQMPAPFDSNFYGGFLFLLQILCGLFLLDRDAVITTASLQWGRVQRYGFTALFVLLSYLFAESARAVAAGAFDSSGIPTIVLPQHTVMNSLESIVWLSAALLTLFMRYRTASLLSFFGAGLWSWDMSTTAGLEMPVWPFYTVWGPLFIVVMVFAGVELNRAWRGEPSLEFQN
jgi:hypothetical protein